MRVTTSNAGFRSAQPSLPACLYRPGKPNKSFLGQEGRIIASLRQPVQLGGVVVQYEAGHAEGLSFITAPFLDHFA
jgi:hypothetical protein